MRVDNEPIIERRFKLNLRLLRAVNDQTTREDVNESTCTCSNKCRLVEKIPHNEGIMIMMNGPDTPHMLQSENTMKGVSNCTCLKILPQLDSNLPNVHPNIYIPSSLLQYPDRIVKYRGGGSGVTVFGGYHPELGSLVMKHGGHKDLIELVSLYKIERELLVRGKSILVDKSSPKDKCNDASQKKNIRNIVTSMAEKIGNQPILSYVRSLLVREKRGGVSNLSKSTSTEPNSSLTYKHSTFNSMPTSTSADTFCTMHKQLSDLEDQKVNDARYQVLENAMNDMKQRIPAFRMVYISPMHLRERQGELKNNTFRHMYLDSLSMSLDGLNTRFPRILPTYKNEKEENLQLSIQEQGRSINLFGSTNKDCSSIQTHSCCVDLCFGGSCRIMKKAAVDKNYIDQVNCCQTCAIQCEESEDDGYKSLIAFVNQLYHHMQFNNWKVTLAQQTIGTYRDDSTKSAPTAAHLLVKGQLRGPLLQKLLDEKIRIIRNLRILTLPNEVDVLAGVKLEYDIIKKRMIKNKENVSASEVSATVNAFVGSAIHKNFNPETGRFVLLKKFGVDLRDGMIHLKPKEVMPAKHLDTILNDCFDKNEDDQKVCRGDSSKRYENSRRLSLEDTFDLIDLEDGDKRKDPLRGNPLYIHGRTQWQTLLELALNMKNPNATCRIWTCGLTDGGLHNLFLGDEQIWMFDLGEPQLVTIPGFLTKFLMSFFHTLGMEEDENGDWVVRFVQDSNKLCLTEDTKDLLHNVFEAFNTATDRLIKEIFDGDEDVRFLLLRYVMTQLISDASFCVEKWRIKGGGDRERSEHQYFLEKWLWRALWDVYVCEEIRRRYICQHTIKRQDKHRS